MGFALVSFTQAPPWQQKPPWASAHYPRPDNVGIRKGKDLLGVRSFDKRGAVGFGLKAACSSALLGNCSGEVWMGDGWVLDFGFGALVTNSQIKPTN